MKKKWIWIIAIACAVVLAACAKVAVAPEAQSEQTPLPTAKNAEPLTLIVTESEWSGWSEEQPEPTERTFEHPAEGTVIYDTGYGTITVDSLTDGAILLKIEHSHFVELNENSTINLAAEPIESITVKRGEEIRLATPTLDGGEQLTIRVTAPGEGLNPYFTCTGTEYGPYPIIPYQQREAEARAFLSEHRELLERAATEQLNGSDIRIFSGEAYMRNDVGKYEPIDAATLSDDLKALVRLSKEADIDFYVCNPDPVFTEDAAAYFNVNFPMAIDETMYTDPGTLYYVALIYTTNTEEQITESYRHDVKSLDGNWFIETYFYAY